MAERKVIAAGTFEEVPRAVPDFDRHAKSMGIKLTHIFCRFTHRVRTNSKSGRENEKYRSKLE